MKLLSWNVINDKNAPATALLAVALCHYKIDELIEMGPEILRNDLESELKIDISDFQSDKLNAALVVLTTETFEEHWSSFSGICHILSGVEADLTVFEPIDAEQIAAALAEVTLIKDVKEPSELVFSDEVRVFVGHVFTEYGMNCAPSIFPSAIMPECEASRVDRESEKDKALQEVFNERKQKIKEYVSNILCQ